MLSAIQTEILTGKVEKWQTWTISVGIFDKEANGGIKIAVLIQIGPIFTNRDTFLETTYNFSDLSFLTFLLYVLLFIILFFLLVIYHYCCIIIYLYNKKTIKNCNSLRKVCLFPLQFRASLPGIVAGIVTKPEFRGLPKKWIDWRSGPHPEAAQPEVAEGHRLDLLPKGDLLSGEVLDRVNNLNVFIHSFLSKVQIFWEGQNNLKKSPNFFEVMSYVPT